MKNLEAIRIAVKYNVSVSQQAIRYCLKFGLLPLGKTANPKNMKSNSELDFIISADDMDKLKNIERIKTKVVSANLLFFWSYFHYTKLRE